MRNSRWALLALACAILTGCNQASAQGFQTSARGFGRWYFAGSLTGDFLTTDSTQSASMPSPFFDGPSIPLEGSPQSQGTSNSSYAFSLGRQADFGGFQIRIEGEGRWYENTSFMTSGTSLPDEFNPFPPDLDEGEFEEFFDEEFLEEFDLLGTGPSQVSVTDRWSGMCNLWIDKPVSEFCEIYVGGGLGASGFSLGLDNTGLSNTDFAYQLGLGLGCSLLTNLQLDIGYRYIDLGNVNLAIPGGPGDIEGPPVPPQDLAVDFHSHQVLVTLRYFFR